MLAVVLATGSCVFANDSIVIETVTTKGEVIVTDIASGSGIDTDIATGGGIDTDISTGSGIDTDIATGGGIDTDIKPEGKPEDTPATKPEDKPEGKPEDKPEDTPTTKPEEDVVIKPDVSTDSAVTPEDGKPEGKPEDSKPENKPDSDDEDEVVDGDSSSSSSSSNSSSSNSSSNSSSTGTVEIPTDTEEEVPVVQSPLPPIEVNWSFDRPAIAFKDIKATHWASKYITMMTTNGIMIGAADGKFYPGKTVSTTEVYTVLSRLISSGKVTSIQSKAIANMFTAINNKTVGGPIFTRGELAILLHTLVGGAESTDVIQAMTWMETEGIMLDGSSNAAMTRGELAAIIARVMDTTLRIK